jgi:hypothetical protein
MSASASAASATGRRRFAHQPSVRTLRGARVDRRPAPGWRRREPGGQPVREGRIGPVLGGQRSHPASQYDQLAQLVRRFGCGAIVGDQLVDRPI